MFKFGVPKEAFKKVPENKPEKSDQPPAQTEDTSRSLASKTVREIRAELPKGSGIESLEDQKERARMLLQKLKPVINVDQAEDMILDRSNLETQKTLIDEQKTELENIVSELQEKQDKLKLQNNPSFIAEREFNEREESILNDFVESKTDYQIFTEKGLVDEETLKTIEELEKQLVLAVGQENKKIRQDLRRVIFDLKDAAVKALIDEHPIKNKDILAEEKQALAQETFNEYLVVNNERNLELFEENRRTLQSKTDILKKTTRLLDKTILEIEALENKMGETSPEDWSRLQAEIVAKRLVIEEQRKQIEEKERSQENIQEIERFQSGFKFVEREIMTSLNAIKRLLSKKLGEGEAEKMISEQSFREVLTNNRSPIPAKIEKELAQSLFLSDENPQALEAALIPFGLYDRSEADKKDFYEIDRFIKTYQFLDKFFEKSRAAEAIYEQSGAAAVEEIKYKIDQLHNKYEFIKRVIGFEFPFVKGKTGPEPQEKGKKKRTGLVWKTLEDISKMSVAEKNAKKTEIIDLTLKERAKNEQKNSSKEALAEKERAERERVLQQIREYPGSVGFAAAEGSKEKIYVAFTASTYSGGARKGQRKLELSRIWKVKETGVPEVLIEYGDINTTKEFDENEFKELEARLGANFNDIFEMSKKR